MKKNFFIFIFVFLSLFITTTTFAYSSDPKKFIGEIVDEAKKILVATNSKEFKEKELSAIALRAADIKGIGFYTLGPIRKTLNSDQKKEYLKLFNNYFLKSFSSRLAEYTNPEIDVLGKDILNEKYTIVKSLLKGTKDRPEVKIDWRIYTKNPENPLIRDLIIEGLSLARTQKEEFASILNSNNSDINVLFQTLEKFSNN